MHLTFKIQCIIGLGNPGPKYEATRHNAGAWFIEEICRHHQIQLTPDPKFKCQSGKLSGHPHEVKIGVPSTYMNESGFCLQKLLHFFKFKPQEILVAHDDLDLPVGTVRLKFDGGHGGHNGLRDIINKMGSKQFYRLRIGIGHPGHREDVLNYVLKSPSISDRQRIDSAIDKAVDVLAQVIDGQQSKAMNHLHTIT